MLKFYSQAGQERAPACEIIFGQVFQLCSWASSHHYSKMLKFYSQAGQERAPASNNAGIHFNISQKRKEEKYDGERSKQKIIDVTNMKSYQLSHRGYVTFTTYH
ncbi:hypothetical protein RND71_038469 [Anisodus tanguticus]|uniref:Uncharacterized protein n=1 Tax=Anisodus tanguticus TaxID=243964 RepID=A0AAE1US53_9SOLA|nr:hypothetical protein RND71_038469 [Anisodus tanguticus]